MGTDYFEIELPFMFWHREGRENPSDWRLFAPAEEWEDWAEEFDGHLNGWSIRGLGEIGGARWEKGDHEVEVLNACLVTASKTYFASKSRKALEEWRKDQGLEGEILEDQSVTHRG